jgi:hypothetical protein
MTPLSKGRQGGFIANIVKVLLSPPLEKGNLSAIISQSNSIPLQGLSLGEGKGDVIPMLGGKSEAGLY